MKPEQGYQLQRWNARAKQYEPQSSFELDGDAVRAWELIREGDGDPEAAEELTHGGAWVGVGDELVVLFR